jgi:hypothetical protein
MTYADRYLMLAAESTAKGFVGITLGGAKFEVAMQSVDAEPQFLEGEQQAYAIGAPTEGYGQKPALWLNADCREGLLNVI